MCVCVCLGVSVCACVCVHVRVCVSGCECVCVCVSALWSSAPPVYSPQAREPGVHGAVSAIRSPCPTGAKAGLILLLLSVGSHFGPCLACVHLNFKSSALSAVSAQRT